MSSPLYNLQGLKEAVGLTDVRIPTSQEIDKIRVDQFTTNPGAGKGSTYPGVPAPHEDGKFDGNFIAGPLERVTQTRDLVQKGSIFYSVDKQGIAAKSANGILSAVTFDLILTESHELSATVCSHPVQNNAPITDHIQPMPTRVKFRVLVSEYSLKDAPGGVRGGPFDTAVSRGRATFDAFRSIFENRMSCDVVLVLATYKDMVLTSVSAPRDGSTGECQEFEVEAVQIKRANLRAATIGTVAKPASMKTSDNRKASTTESAGRQTPDDEEFDPTAETLP